MARKITIESREQLDGLRTKLRETREKLRLALKGVIQASDFMDKLKFDRLGCDPLDPDDPQNLVEQVNQQATYEVALDAVDWLWRRPEHRNRTWHVAPGAHASGHDIESADKDVAAEVFAAVKPTNNDKLKKDIEKVAKFNGGKYVFYRSPGDSLPERLEGDVVVVALGLARP